LAETISGGKMYEGGDPRLKDRKVLLAKKKEEGMKRKSNGWGESSLNEKSPIARRVLPTKRPGEKGPFKRGRRVVKGAF